MDDIMDDKELKRRMEVQKKRLAATKPIPIITADPHLGIVAIADPHLGIIPPPKRRDNDH